MQPIAGKPVEQSRVVAHQPDDQSAARCHTGVHAGLLQIGGLAAFFQQKTKLRMGPGHGVDDTGAGAETPFPGGRGLAGGSSRVRPGVQGEQAGQKQASGVRRAKNSHVANP